MKKYKLHIVAINLILVLAFVTYSIVKKEKTLSKGKLVLLELAPVDPRSLMQGDYMRLQYKIAQTRDFREPQIVPEIEKIPKFGYLIVQLDSNHVAQKIRLQKDLQPLKSDEIPIKYHKNKWQIYLGAESFFFQEGNAKKYEKAKYGALRVDKKGNSILTNLYNEKIEPIK